MKYYILVMVVLLSFPPVLEAAELHGGWNEAGVRMGMQVAKKQEYFQLYETYAAYGLPWNWRSETGWTVASQLNASIGALYTSADTGFIGSIGTGLSLSKAGFGLVPELGISADIMDKRYYGRQDCGSTLLFGAYIGMSYQFDNGLGIGYRLLHLSNGHIFYPEDTPNPGIDLHTISISWHF